MHTYSQAKARIENMKPQFTTRQLDFIFADWPEGEEHYSWLMKASRKEIYDWIIAGDPELASAAAAASALRAIPSDKRSQAARDNGKLGGRPRKEKDYSGYDFNTGKPYTK